MERELITPDAPAASAQATARARIKVLDPLTSIGPSMEAELLADSGSDLRLRIQRYIIPGSTVQVLTHKGVVFGTVWFAAEAASGSTGFEVDVDVAES